MGSRSVHELPRPGGHQRLLRAFPLSSYSRPTHTLRRSTTASPDCLNRPLRARPTLPPTHPSSLHPSPRPPKTSAPGSYPVPFPSTSSPARPSAWSPTNGLSTPVVSPPKVATLLLKLGKTQPRGTTSWRSGTTVSTKSLSQTRLCRTLPASPLFKPLSPPSGRRPILNPPASLSASSPLPTATHGRSRGSRSSPTRPVTSPRCKR